MSASQCTDLAEKKEEVVDPELFKKSLFNLGKTFNNARHAYLSLNLSSNSLTHINVSLPPPLPAP